MKTKSTLFLIFISSIFYAQSSNDLLLTKYSQDDLVTMEKNNPDEYNFINYSCKNGYYFVDLPEKKNFNDRIFGNVVIDDIDDFNFLLLDIEFLKDDYKYYTVQNKNVLLVVKSIDHINAELKANNDKN